VTLEFLDQKRENQKDQKSVPSKMAKKPDHTQQELSNQGQARKRRGNEDGCLQRGLSVRHALSDRPSGRERLAGVGKGGRDRGFARESDL
jgi:hypothetical protein